MLQIALMVVPTLAFFPVFVVVPIVYSLYYSLTNFVGFGTAKFTGVANYLTLFRNPLSASHSLNRSGHAAAGK